MANPELLRNHLLTGELDSESISAHMELAEASLTDCARWLRGEGADLFARLTQRLADRPETVVAAMRLSPQSAAVMFAFLPAREMFQFFAMVEEVDASLLPMTVGQAQGAVRVVAQERFGFVAAMSKLCALLVTCRNRPRSVAPNLS